MDIEIAKIVREISKDLIAEARLIMESSIGINEKVGYNTLKNSDLYNQIEYRVIESDGVAINILFNYYITFVESGRRKGAKMPPIDVIQKWLIKKNIAPLNKNIRSVAFLIARSISREGIKARPILENLFNKTEEKWGNVYADMLFNEIIKELTEYFN